MFKIEDLSAICQTMALANGHRSMMTQEFEFEAFLPFPFYQSILKEMANLEKRHVMGTDGKEHPIEAMQWIKIQFPFNVSVMVHEGEKDFIVRPVNKMAKILPMPSNSDLLRPTGGNRA